MENDDEGNSRRANAEQRRDQALAKYDAHPGIAIALLCVMVILVGVVAYGLLITDGPALRPPPSQPSAPATR
jgi:hypothetical protein